MPIFCDTQATVERQHLCDEETYNMELCANLSH